MMWILWNEIFVDLLGGERGRVSYELIEVLCTTNTLLSPSSCLYTYRTDCLLVGKLIGVGRWRHLSEGDGGI